MTQTRERVLLTTLVVLAAATAFAGGAFMQRFYGMGNILRALNPSYIPLSKRKVIKPQHIGQLEIFVLTGQSNMQGGGKLSEYKTLETFGRVYAFGDDFRWSVAKESLSGNLVGSGLSFAHELSKTGRVIGLVPCAAGGTSILQWQRNADEKSLYGRCLMKARAASVAGQIAGLLFLQGENDATQSVAPKWIIYFSRLVNGFRTDVGNPRLPVLFGQLGSGSGKRWANVKASQTKVSLPHTRTIKTDDLSYFSDGGHFTTQSQIAIGKRFVGALKVGER